jgi:hypothetical protein
MADPNDIAQIASRVDRLLLRHQELQRTNDLLSAQVAALTSEEGFAALTAVSRPGAH